jgi:hypothetical protein
MLSAAVRLPLADGLKVRLIVQLAPAASEPAQVLVWAKSLASASVSAMLVRLKAASPVLLKMTVCAALIVPTV